MIAHIEGTVAEKHEGEIVIDCGGVGYLLNVSRTTLAQAPSTGQRFRLLARMTVREDSMDLYGFASAEERRLFDQLTNVTRVGPKMALGILSALPPTELARALALGDVSVLKRIPGVGLKTAQRLVLELKEKIDEDVLVGGSVSLPQGNAETEAISALTALGYSALEASQAVGRAAAAADGADVGELVRNALKAMNFGG